MIRVRVAPVSELHPEVPLAVVAADRKVVLVHDGARVRALGGLCPHAGAPLAGGRVRGCVLTCPWHAAAFDLVTGRPLRGPARKSLPTYPVEVRDGHLWVAVPGDTAPSET